MVIAIMEKVGFLRQCTSIINSRTKSQADSDNASSLPVRWSPILTWFWPMNPSPWQMSVFAPAIDLMVSLKNELGLTFLFITHDLATAKYICDRIGILYLGRLSKSANCAKFIPIHYTPTPSPSWLRCLCRTRINVVRKPCPRVKSPTHPSAIRLPLPSPLSLCERCMLA